jgi:glycosyltransferase involved in cell wall biosynthesis
MNILHITPSYYPAFKYGGPIQSVHLLNKTLVKKGLRVDVITTDAGLEGRNDIPLNRWAFLDDVRVRYLKYYGYEHYTFSPRLFFEIFKGMEKYDLIHITAVWNFPVLAGAIASLIYKKPYIISPRGTIYEQTIKLKSSNKKMLYFNVIARQYLQRANAIHFTTTDEQEEVTKYLKLTCSSFVVPNGLDFSEFKEPPEKRYLETRYPVLVGKRNMLFLGRINIKKGIDILIESFKKLAEEYKDLFLVLAGPDNENYGEEIKVRLGKYGVLNKTIFTGMITGKEKLSVYNDAELFVLPSYSENFGMSVVEAMACGVPVVISNKVGIYKEVENNKAGVVVETNPESLHRGIKSLLDNETRRKEIAENGRRLAESYYDIDMVADMMIKTYEGVLRSARTKTNTNKRLWLEGSTNSGT